jgi:hypothetical protein
MAGGVTALSAASSSEPQGYGLGAARQRWTAFNKQGTQPTAAVSHTSKLRGYRMPGHVCLEHSPDPWQQSSKLRCLIGVPCTALTSAQLPPACVHLHMLQLLEGCLGLLLPA